MPNSIASLNMTALTRDTLATALPQFGFLKGYSTDFSGELMPKGATSLSVNTFAAITGAEYTSASTTYAVQDITSTARTITPTILYGHQTWNEVSEAGTPIEVAAKLAPVLMSAVAAQAFAKVGALVTAANYSTSLLSTAANFDADDLTDLDSQLDTAQASRGNRYAIIKPTYKRYLASDNAIQAAYAYGSNQVVATGNIPNVHGFNIIPVTGTIPANAEALEGWVSAPEAMVMAARMPNFDSGLTQNAQVGEAVDPDTGLPIQMRYWFDINTGLHHLWAGTRFGVATGLGTALIRIRSA